MDLRDFALHVVRSVEKKLDPPYVPATREQRLLDAIFPTTINHPWPEEVQPMPGNMWRDDLDDHDWASYVSECIRGRTSTPIGLLQIAHSLLSSAAANTQGTRPEVYAAAHEAEKIMCAFLDRLEDAPPYYYDPEYGDEVLCNCGHPYYRHFDTYDDMEPVGCKYCGCVGFWKGTDEAES